MKRIFSLLLAPVVAIALSMSAPIAKAQDTSKDDTSKKKSSKKKSKKKKDDTNATK
jgi:Ni/Co efflux regulator RcnB